MQVQSSTIGFSSVSRNDDNSVTNTGTFSLFTCSTSNSSGPLEDYFGYLTIGLPLVGCLIKIGGSFTFGWIQVHQKRTDQSDQTYICLSPYKTTAGWYQLSVGIILKATDDNSKKDIVVSRQGYLLTSTPGESPVYNFSDLPEVSITPCVVIGKLIKDL